jgi:hypothetical protein
MVCAEPLARRVPRGAERTQARRPPLGPPPRELSSAAQALGARSRRARLFVCLRRLRHAWFSAAFPAALARLFQDRSTGQPPVPPVLLALGPRLPASTGASDDEALEALTMDRRGPLVCDGLDGAEPPVSKAPLVRLRAALIAHGLDRRRLARPQGRGLAAVAVDAGAELVVGARLKAALDLEWDAPAARARAVGVRREPREAVERWLAVPPGVRATTVVPSTMAAARQICAQDGAAADHRSPRWRRGVARARRLSLEAPARRHGRKRRRQRSDGSTRQGRRDLDSGLGRAGGVPPATAPEAAVTDAIMADRERQGAQRSVVHFPAAVWAAWPVPGRCPRSAQGRSVSIPPDEPRRRELRERQPSPAGRAKLPERVAVAHALAHVGRWPGRRARYRGLRKHLCEGRRAAGIHHLPVLARHTAGAPTQAA